MTELIMLTIGLLAGLICLMDWRKGIFVCILAGFLQDPLRKLTEGEPVYLSALVALFVTLTFLGIKMSGKRINVRYIDAWKSGLNRPATFFVVLVFVQSIAAFFATGSIAVSGIGLIAYLFPIPAFLLSYYYVSEVKDITRFIRFYILIAAIVTSGIYLSYMEVDWAVLRQVGEGIFAYAPSGEKLTLHAGFLRAPETAAWHAATAICMIILLVTTGRALSFRWSYGILVIFFLGAMILTGRRKVLIEIVLFISIYGFLLAYFRRGATKLAILLLIVGLSFAVLSNSYLFRDEVVTGFKPYFQREASVRQEASERLYNMTIGSFRWVIAQNGILGSGAGTGSQGAQHFGGGSDIVGGAAEGGLGKILAELGLPGLVLFLWMVSALFRYFWRLMVSLKRDDPIRARLVYGLTSFLLANAAVFATAHQVFGDPFVLLILGWVLGFVLAIPGFAKAEYRKGAAADFLSRSPVRGLPAISQNIAKR